MFVEVGFLVRLGAVSKRKKSETCLGRESCLGMRVYKAKRRRCRSSVARKSAKTRIRAVLR
jgi:hypothetical protein